MTVNLAICQFSPRWLVLARAGPRWLALGWAGLGWLALAWADSRWLQSWLKLAFMLAPAGSMVTVHSIIMMQVDSTANVEFL